MVKDKDPSDIMNDVNGFDIITCKGMQEVQIILVIPNIGYGFLSIQHLEVLTELQADVIVTN